MVDVPSKLSCWSLVVVVVVPPILDSPQLSPLFPPGLLCSQHLKQIHKFLFHWFSISTNLRWSPLTDIWGLLWVMVSVDCWDVCLLSNSLQISTPFLRAHIREKFYTTVQKWKNTWMSFWRTPTYAGSPEVCSGTQNPPVSLAQKKVAFTKHVIKWLVNIINQIVYF